MYEDFMVVILLTWYYLQARIKKSKKRTILCYPKKPVSYHVLYQLCRFNGFTITTIPQKADAVVYFEDTTYRTYDATIRMLGKENTVINYHCSDISKKKVDTIHTKVFGYSLEIDPQTYKGEYVKKGNANSLHNGIILSHPERPQKGYVYQLLVQNEVDDELVEIRLPIFKNIIPFAYLKYRPLSCRFLSNNNRVMLVKTEQVISKNEYQKIVLLCEKLGLDYGELDVLRDAKTKKLYIVDANNTPAGPPYQLPLSEYKRTMELMSRAFQQAFLVTFFAHLVILT